MIYRLAWVVERHDYMETRPVSEQLMGLGMVLEGDPLIYKMYNFGIGLKTQVDMLCNCQLLI